MILLLKGKILWNDSKVHIFLEIYENEMEKINWRTGPLEKKSKATCQNPEWLPLKNKFYSIKKLYDIYRRLGRMTEVLFHYSYNGST